MLALSPIASPFEWADFQALENNNIMNLAPCFSPSFPSSQDHDDHDKKQHDYQDHVRRGESPQSTSSIDHISPSILAKKISHNASERDRRKKINGLYSTLRALLPSTNQTKKLSVPTTVGMVLDYIPELQKEVDDLTHKKDELLSKISLLQGDNSRKFSRGKGRKKDKNIIKEKPRNSIFVNNLGEREIIIQISIYEKISLPDVMLLLENNGLSIIDVSSFQPFGGRTFYNLHLCMERTNNLKCGTLNEVLQSLIEKHNQQVCY